MWLIIGLCRRSSTDILCRLSRGAKATARSPPLRNPNYGSSGLPYPGSSIVADQPNASCKSSGSASPALPFTTKSAWEVSGV